MDKKKYFKILSYGFRTNYGEGDINLKLIIIDISLNYCRRDEILPM